jgi:hypothetical protein
VAWKGDDLGLVAISVEHVQVIELVDLLTVHNGSGTECDVRDRRPGQAVGVDTASVVAAGVKVPYWYSEKSSCGDA